MACLALIQINSRFFLCKEVSTACRASSPRPLAAPSAAKLRSTHCLAPSPLSHPTAQGPQSPPGYLRSRQNRSMGRRDRERGGGYKSGLWGEEAVSGKKEDGQASGREDETTGVLGGGGVRRWSGNGKATGRAVNGEGWGGGALTAMGSPATAVGLDGVAWGERVAMALRGSPGVWSIDLCPRARVPLAVARKQHAT